jgi:hypothetical protein
MTKGYHYNASSVDGKDPHRTGKIALLYRSPENRFAQLEAGMSRCSNNVGTAQSLPAHTFRPASNKNPYPQIRFKSDYPQVRVDETTHHRLKPLPCEDKSLVDEAVQQLR